MTTFEGLFVDTSDTALIHAFAALTHRIHVTERGTNERQARLLRRQRDGVQDEILRRMKRA